MMKGYEQKKYPVATKRYVQWLELESDEEAIREYRRLHSEGVQWKEIRDGIRQVGILEMEIYIFGKRLVMVVDAPVDFDWDKKMAELATLPRQAESQPHESTKVQQAVSKRRLKSFRFFFIFFRFML